MRAHAVRLRRVYDPVEPEDGTRVLIDRLWPRGLSREKAAVDIWLKEIAPSDKIRREFGHDRRRWPHFAAAYRAELASNPAALEQLLALCDDGQVTLLYAAHDTECNNAVVVAAVLEGRDPAPHG
ncbi:MULTISPECIES: DUF488 domain-containing protein [Acidiphilium]|jgi:uncharacterized protein YeaO (DUF488 family)|uniref:DUF488 domain-containing protein n=1 Tax=Acidiphilium TaxID=522 RepID=UPI0002144D38|nr:MULTISPECIES: DUF488 family protein [Acidiphilium]MDE2344326.1 DUF488 family protein [Betaproteobacteria bacterium]OYV67683.1 MAG: hypothetical protein B7X09_00645 [Acidiphilium sp. 21-66-27]OYW12683.1 MAG: hypothetical protein B7Z59_00330 [Acidiphilium sp. 37-67-22]HQT72438.1 DUF488 family protein [Acidiphilium sp.]EGO93334.1 hypothetical protein APM_0271 [Acidiphilium sp. PM]